MGPRLHVPAAELALDGESFALNEGASRHLQVLRSQPGDPVRVFDGEGHEWQGVVTEMGRKVVRLRLGERVDNDRELGVRVTLAVGMPANDRMDALVEKATELGVFSIQPLVCARSVLRLDGDRAIKKVVHWQGVAAAASEQCGRAVVPRVHPVNTLQGWLKEQADALREQGGRCSGVLSLSPEAVPVRHWLADRSAAPEGACSVWVFLSGPEGGLAPEEEALATALGWQAVSLGRRVLRADTAPLAVLSVLGAHLGG